MCDGELHSGASSAVLPTKIQIALARDVATLNRLGLSRNSIPILSELFSRKRIRLLYVCAPKPLLRLAEIAQIKLAFFPFIARHDPSHEFIKQRHGERCISMIGAPNHPALD